MSETVTTLCKTAKNLDFAAVAAAMEQSNICSDVERAVEAFLREKSLLEVPHLFMATHSMGGRGWEVKEGREPVFFNEKTFGSGAGWYIFTEEDVAYLHCSSATSGSSLTAEKEEDGTWTMWLEVPVQAKAPYRGAYWRAFHAALRLEDEYEDSESLQAQAAPAAAAQERGPNAPLEPWEQELLVTEPKSS